MAATINRAPFNALVDDSGQNLDGTPWNKAAIKGVLLDPIDAALAQVPTTGQLASVLLTRANGVNTSTTGVSSVQFTMPALGALDTVKIYVTVYQGSGTGGAMYLSAFGDKTLIRLDNMGGGSLAAGRFGIWDITMRSDPNNAVVRTTLAVGGTLPINTADTIAPVAAGATAMVLGSSSWINGNWILSLDVASTGAMNHYWHWAVYRLI